ADAVLDAGALDLDDDVLTLGLRGVDLGDRGRRERRRVEVGQLGGVGAELGGEDALDLVEAEGPDAVEALAELLAPALGEDAGRRRDDLAELDEGGSHVLGEEPEEHREGVAAAAEVQLVEEPEDQVLGRVEVEGPDAPQRRGGYAA